MPKTATNRLNHPKNPKRQRKVPPAPIDSAVLKSLRQKAGLSLSDLARKSNVSVQSLSRLEKKDESADTRTLAALAKIFNVPVGFLLKEQIHDLSRFCANQDTYKALKSFLDVLRGSPDTVKTLSSFTRFLKNKRNSEPVPKRIDLTLEEEILGNWTSLIVAYEEANWQKMLKHATVVTNLGNLAGRPYLAALGHAYSAKALRNIGKNSDQKSAQEELNKISPEYKTVLIYRLKGKILAHNKQTQQAKESFEAGLAMLNQENYRNRDDYLFALEKTKLYRNLARCYTKLIAERPDNKNSYQKLAFKCIRKTEISLKELKKHCIRTYSVEKMLLFSAKFHLSKTINDLSQAIKAAISGLTYAISAKAPYGIAKMKIFLTYAYWNTEQFKKAYQFCQELLADYPEFPLPLKKTFHSWIDKKMISNMSKWLRHHIQEINAPTSFRPTRNEYSLLRRKEAYSDDRIITIPLEQK